MSQIKNISEDKTTRIACIGDSLTYGLFVRNRQKNCYPARLKAMLGPNYTVYNFGVTGLTLQKTGDNSIWNHENFEASTSFDPHVVIIMLGSNDTKPHNWTDINHFVRDYKDLIRHYQSLPNKPRIYLVTPPTAYTSKRRKNGFFRINNMIIKEICTAIKDLGSEQQLPVIDVNTVTAHHPEYFPIDGVHTNEKGAQIIAATIFKTLYPS